MLIYLSHRRRRALPQRLRPLVANLSVLRTEALAWTTAWFAAAGTAIYMFLMYMPFVSLCVLQVVRLVPAITLAVVDTVAVH